MFSQTLSLGPVAELRGVFFQRLGNMGSRTRKRQLARKREDRKEKAADSAAGTRTRSQVGGTLSSAGTGEGNSTGVAALDTSSPKKVEEVVGFDSSLAEVLALPASRHFFCTRPHSCIHLTYSRPFILFSCITG